MYAQQLGLCEAYKAPTFHFLCGCKSLPSSLTDNDSRLVKVCLAVWHMPIYTVFQKGDTKLMTVTLLILNRFSNFFSTDRFSSKLSAKFLLKIPSYLIRVATLGLPCETLMSKIEELSQTNAVINDKLVVTYLRCVGIFNN